MDSRSGQLQLIAELDSRLALGLDVELSLDMELSLDVELGSDEFTFFRPFFWTDFEAHLDDFYIFSVHFFEPISVYIWTCMRAMRACVHACVRACVHAR